MSHLPVEIDVNSVVESLALCDWNDADIAEVVGLPLDQFRRDYHNQLKARDHVLADAVSVARKTIRRVNRYLTEDGKTVGELPRHEYNAGVDMAWKMMQSKGGFSINPVTANVNFDTSDPEVVKALKTLKII